MRMNFSLYQSLGKMVYAGFTVFLLCSTSVFGATTAGEAIVKKVTGTGTYSDSGGKTGNITVGMKFSPGTLINTTAGATVELDLGASGQLTVKADSMLMIGKLDYAGADVQAQFEIKKGAINGNIKALSKASKFEIKAANGLAGVRGSTEFSLDWGGKASVSSGALVLIYVKQGQLSQPTTVTAGQSVSPPTTPGGPPQVK